MKIDDTKVIIRVISAYGIVATNPENERNATLPKLPLNNVIISIFFKYSNNLSVSCSNGVIRS